MICHKLRCIFIHINRNGGKSIERAIWNIESTSASSDHTMIRGWEERLHRDIFDSYFKFTFSRNPWDRIVSLYHYYKQTKRSYKDKKYLNPESIMDSFENFVDFLNSEHGKIVAPTQISWIEDSNDKPRIDFVGRFENFEDDWNKICKRLGIERKLPHLNKSEHDHYRIYYSKELIEKVGELYKEDIKFFNYNF